MALTKISRSLLDTGISDSSDATAITIDSSENVGIGTSTIDTSYSGYVGLELGAQAVINGNRTTSDTGVTSISQNGYLSSASGGSWKYKDSGKAALIQEIDDGTIRFSTTDTSGSADDALTWSERMRISSAGNVAIGTTDTSDVRLRVDQNQNDDYTAFFKNTCAANAVVGVTYSTGETVNAANKFGFQVLDNGTERFAARMDGSVFSSNSTYSSDIRLKENIEDCEPMLEKLRQVRIVDFDWKDGKGPDGRQRGVIAQEIEPIFPELIHEPVEYKEFKKSEMMPILVKAIQEQQEQIEALQSEINTLKGG